MEIKSDKDHSLILGIEITEKNKGFMVNTNYALFSFMISPLRLLAEFLILTTFIVLLLMQQAFASDIQIIVNPSKKIGEVNPLILGNNMIGYDPSTYGDSTKIYLGYSNYGAGVWNPTIMKSTNEAMKLARDVGTSILRFPGGTFSAFYNWKETIGPPQKRLNFLYGLNEFLRTCEEIGAEAVFTLPYFTGTPQDAADLVEYLNANNDGSNPNGGIDWAKERANNGHPQPYNVKYFELGNEVAAGLPKKGIAPVQPETYAADYLNYQAAMKVVDPSVRLGAVITYNEMGGKFANKWNTALFQRGGHAIDFVIEHTYRPWYTSNDTKININKLFQDTLMIIDEVERYYNNLSNHFKALTGRKHLQIAVTEYNGGFVQENPIPLRHSLGTALFNAGLLQIFMKPENNVLMANYWQLANEYWGMIKNDQFMEDKGMYVKRPNYYVFEMFHKHFGTDLLETTTSDKQYTQKKKNNILASQQWQILPIKGTTASVLSVTLLYTY